MAEVFMGFLRNGRMHLPLVYYILTAVGVALVGCVRYLLDPMLVEYHSFPLFLVSIFFATWLGGWKPGLMALILGYLVADWCFIEPRGSFGFFSAKDWFGLFSYLFVGGLAITQFEAMRQRTAALRESEELSRLLLNSAAEAIYGVDLQLNCTFANPACIRLLGFSAASQMLGKNMHELVHHTQRDGMPYPVAECRVYQAMMRGEGCHVMDEVLWRADGSSFQVEYWSYPINRENQTIGAVVTYWDITERVEAQEKQQQVAAERDSLLRQLQLQVKRMPLAYILFDADFCITDWNPTAERMFGYTKAQAIGMGVMDLIPSPSQKEATQILARIQAGDMTAHSVNENITKDGRTIICEWFNTPLLTESGQFDGLLGLVADVSDRKQLETRFQRFQKRLDHVVASSPAILFALAVEGETLQPAWISENVAMLGYGVEESLQPTWWPERVHVEDLQRVQSEFQSILFPRGSLGTEYRFRHQDDSYRWIRSEIRLLRDASGIPVEIVGSLSDVTELKQLEEQFRHAQKMEAVGRLAGGVAHDFNNLLTIIIGYGGMAMNRLPAEDRGREMMQQVLAAGKRAADLTRQLLAFSRKAIIEPTVFDLRVMVGELDKMLQRIIGDDIRLSFLSDPEVDAVEADPGQIEQVILNLVVNASDSMPQGGNITLELRNVGLDQDYAQSHPDVLAGQYVMLGVSDTGCGIDDRTLARIFEPFFTTKGEQGTGLGLATAHGIIKQSGGHIAVESKVGKGTAFKVYLPRSAKSVPVAKPQPEAIMPGGSETVLLVEDEDGVRGLSRRTLQNSGYTVLEARNGKDAVRVADQHQGRIEILLTDVVMPQMGGPEVAACLATTRPDTKVLFMSGYTDDAIVRHGILQSQVAFLQKPFSPTSLVSKVREVLDSDK